jgi:FtsH-binding integral membrane protein
MCVRRGVCFLEVIWVERRLLTRYSKVPFQFYYEDSSELKVIAEDASTRTARFPTAYSKEISQAKGGCFQINGNRMGITNMGSQNSPRSNALILEYESISLSSPLSEAELSFMTLEMTHMWDRFKQLQEKNKIITSTVLKLYAVLFVFAAAPFTLQSFSGTGLSRVWGFGGVWLAITVWFFCDRSFRAYGSFWFEKNFCLRQIAQIRKMMVGSSVSYNRYSLFHAKVGMKSTPDEDKNRTHGNTHISRSQVLYTVYFYKLVSIFQPLYLCLFISLIIFPKEMTDPNVDTSRELFLRVLLGFSIVPFVWLITSMERCFGLLKNAFRARRISTKSPWPRFPDEDKHKFHLFGQSKIIYKLLIASALIVSLCNLIRFIYLLLDKQEDVAYWWATLDWHLLAITASVFVLIALYHEMDVRHVLSNAKEYFPLPDDGPDQLTA